MQPPAAPIEEAAMSVFRKLSASSALNVSFMNSATHCDLPMLSRVVLGTMAPLLERRGQSAEIERPAQEITVRGDLRLVSALLSAIFIEAAGLSSAGARLKVAFDLDEEDAVVTVVGWNSHRLALQDERVDASLADLAAEAGAEIDLIWEQEEGPTLVLRFPQRRLRLRA